MKSQIIQRAYDHLQPGGWLECQEAPAMIGCDDGTMPDDYGWRRWVQDFEAVSRLANRQTDVGPKVKEWMEEVGFVDVQEVMFKVPLNGWPKDPRLKHIGMLWQRNLLEGLSGFSLGMFHRFMGKTVEEIEVGVALLLSRSSLTVFSFRWWTCGKACSTATSTPTTGCTWSGAGSPTSPSTWRSACARIVNTYTAPSR